MAAIANGDFGLSARLKLNKLLSLGTTVQTDFSYTLTPADESTMIALNRSSGVSVVVPVGLGQGFTCSIAQLGTGVVTITPGSGVVLHAWNDDFTLAGQFAQAELIAYGTDAYLLAHGSVLAEALG